LDDLAQPTEERQEAERMSWFVEALKKYAVFSGRSRRKEYWYFVLFVVIITVALNMLDLLVGTHTRSGVGVLSSLFSLAVLIPSIAVSVRRLHDIDRTGWWVLISLVPLIGWIVLVVFHVQDSTPGSNRFGLNPKSTEYQSMMAEGQSAQ
jgi:uncharacterized membrane protein YhaH (DUF805 family)